MSRKAPIAAIGLIAAVLAATGAISASAANDDSSANQLVGSWELTVNRGPALPLIKGLTTYTPGHSLIGTANVVIRGPAHGAWEHVSGRVYADTHIFFRFDATGTFLGTQKIRETVELAQDGDSYTAVAFSDQFDPNGNLTASGLQRPSPPLGSRSNQRRRPSAEEARGVARAFSRYLLKLALLDPHVARKGGNCCPLPLRLAAMGMRRRLQAETGRWQPRAWRPAVRTRLCLNARRHDRLSSVRDHDDIAGLEIWARGARGGPRAMAHVAVNGLGKYYEVHGDEPPLLLLHRGSGRRRDPSCARDRLTPDQKLQFGLGASSSPRKAPPTGAMMTVTSLAGRPLSLRPMWPSPVST